MTTCVEQHPVNTICSGQDSCKVKDRAESLASSHSHVSRNVFTACHVSKHPNAAEAKTFLDKHCPQFRRDMETQRALVQHNKEAAVCERVGKNEASFIISEEARQISVKSLLRTAAERDVKLARTWNYPIDVIHFIRRTWQVILQQVHELFKGTPSDSDASSPLPCTSQEALENISSIGIWFMGHMSLPLRRYSFQVPDANGVLQEVIAMGVVSFAYSSYVMDSRRRSQSATLAELDRLSRRLSFRLRFLPALVLPLQAAEAAERGRPHEL